MPKTQQLIALMAHIRSHSRDESPVFHSSGNEIRNRNHVLFRQRVRHLKCKNVMLLFELTPGLSLKDFSLIRKVDVAVINH